MAKFKVGDKVKIIGNSLGASSGLIGNGGEVILIDIAGNFGVNDGSDEILWWFSENDLEFAGTEQDYTIKKQEPKRPLPPAPKTKLDLSSKDVSQAPKDYEKNFTGTGGTLVVNEAGGKKADGGKLDYTLLLKDLPNSVESVVKVLELGSIKYGRTNYSKVEDARYEAALCRHLMQYLSGESIDKESGEHHLSHLICCALFIVESCKKGKGG